jgi:hypothetical protein
MSTDLDEWATQQNVVLTAVGTLRAATEYQVKVAAAAGTAASDSGTADTEYTSATGTSDADALTT